MSSFNSNSFVRSSFLLKYIQKIRNKFLNKLDKFWFQNAVAYGDFKYLRRTAADKVLCDKPFIIAKDPKYEGCQRDLASIVQKIFDKKTSCSSIKNENISNKEIVEEICKPVIISFNTKKAYSAFIDITWDFLN